MIVFCSCVLVLASTSIKELYLSDCAPVWLITLHCHGGGAVKKLGQFADKGIAQNVNLQTRELLKM